jgi:hypothetical protein
MLKNYTTYSTIDDFFKIKVGKNIYYSPPDSAQELLFDFYLITAFKNRDVSGMRDDSLQASFDDAVKKVIFATHQHILDATLDGILQEVQHAFTISPFKGDKGSLLFVSSFGLDFALQRIGMPNALDEYFSLQDDMASHSSEDPEYTQILADMQTTIQNVCNDFLSDDEATIVANSLIIFSEVEWVGNYGGSLWANICQAWLNLYNTTNSDQAIVLIDHIYDLHHNTGSVLNKSSDYINVDIDWALDAKANGSYWDLYDNCSLSAKSLMSRVLKNTVGESSDIGSRTIDPSKEESDSTNFF